MSGLPDLEWRSIFLPSRNAKQRNPSHLGSYCHCCPTGRVVAGKASIGGYFLESGNVISMFQAFHRSLRDVFR